MGMFLYGKVSSSNMEQIGLLNNIDENNLKGIETNVPMKFRIIFRWRECQLIVE